MKRFFAKIHLWLSIPVGLFLAIICLTGASLVFEQEITRALNGDLYQVEVPRDQSRLTPSQLEACIRKLTECGKTSLFRISGILKRGQCQ